MSPEYGWMTGTPTTTEGELITWCRIGDQVFLTFPTPNGVDPEGDHAVFLSFKQAQDMMCGLAYVLNKIKEARDAAH